LGSTKVKKRWENGKGRLTNAISKAACSLFFAVFCREQISIPIQAKEKRSSFPTHEIMEKENSSPIDVVEEVRPVR
jgi:hypothetical protein